MGRAPLGGVGRTPGASRRVEVYDIGWGIKTFSILMNKLFFSTNHKSGINPLFHSSNFFLQNLSFVFLPMGIK